MFGGLQFGSEPFANGLVVESDKEIGCGYQCKEDDECYGPNIAESQGVVPYPCIKEVHERIVDDVDWIGDSS